MVKPSWYEQAEAAVRAEPIDYVFIGSSRVAAGVDADTFESSMAMHLGRPVRALNLGMGYSTYHQHLVGLQRLVDAAPENLKKVTVLIEAPGGVGYLGDWGDEWYAEGQPQLLLNVLRPRDIATVWRSPAALSQKIGVTCEWLWGHSILLSRHKLLHRRIQNYGRVLTAHALTFLQVAEPDQSTSSRSDLTTAGGVRVDSDGIQCARDYAVKSVHERLAGQRLIKAWDSTLYASLGAMLGPLHGRVVFYRVPESSVFESLYTSQIGRANVANFEEYFPQMCSIMLEPDFKPEDTDFPDLWHLSKTRAHVFTRALANALIAADSRGQP